MVNNNKTIIVGVSGGPDSIYLLNKLLMEGYEPKVVHVNYKLREEADYDESIVREYCTKHNIDAYYYSVTKEDKSKYSYLGNNQSIYRAIRYNIYFEQADKYNTKEIYIAHHKDDFLETAIMKENRSNDYLFYGIKELSIYNGYNIHRPLLNIYKSDIIEYLDSNNIAYAIDKTNEQPIYERNKVRLSLKDKSKEEKDLLIDKYISINKQKEELSNNIDNIYVDFMNSGYSYDYYSNINDQYKKYIIYELLIKSEYHINVSKDKLEGIIQFLSNKRGDKDFRLMESIFLGVKSNIIKIYSI